MSRLVRMRNRLHILETKSGELTPGERVYVEYLKEVLSAV